jgi:hypothetical protein
VFSSRIQQANIHENFKLPHSKPNLSQKPSLLQGLTFDLGVFAPFIAGSGLIA